MVLSVAMDRVFRERRVLTHIQIVRYDLCRVDDTFFEVVTTPVNLGTPMDG